MDFTKSFWNDGLKKLKYGVEELLSYYDLHDKIEDVIRWYDGYHFRKERIYNPWSILNYIFYQGAAKPYWVNTGSNSLFGDILESSSDSELKEMFDLIHGDAIVTNIDSTINYQSKDKSLFSYLLMTGYITAKKNINGNRYLVQILNEEIKETFRSEIMDRFSTPEQNNLIFQFHEAMRNGRSDELSDLLKKYVLSCFSCYDFSDEGNYPIMVMTLSILLFSNAFLKSEVNVVEGRCDIMISPKEKNGIGFVIEIQHLKSVLSKARMKAVCQKAI